MPNFDIGSEDPKDGNNRLPPRDMDVIYDKIKRIIYWVAGRMDFTSRDVFNACQFPKDQYENANKTAVNLKIKEYFERGYIAKVGVDNRRPLYQKTQRLEDFMQEQKEKKEQTPVKESSCPEKKESEKSSIFDEIERINQRAFDEYEKIISKKSKLRKKIRTLTSEYEALHQPQMKLYPYVNQEQRQYIVDKYMPMKEGEE